MTSFLPPFLLSINDRTRIPFVSVRKAWRAKNHETKHISGCFLRRASSVKGRPCNILRVKPRLENPLSKVTLKNASRLSVHNARPRRKSKTGQLSCSLEHGQIVDLIKSAVMKSYGPVCLISKGSFPPFKTKATRLQIAKASVEKEDFPSAFRRSSCFCSTSIWPLTSPNRQPRGVINCKARAFLGPVAAAAL